ncbi:MAG: ATP-dependent helicase HrpB [Caulobacteraceae bacterium]|nr:ATP-dependent helicase HrpB [Caulobacteraceae bacterium]
MLPIHAVLDELKAALSRSPCAVLVAPPGAGKTTVAPLALLDEPWAGGRKILVLEPRRLAARAAAARMAAALGEAVGETVGYRVRLQSKVTARTRIEVITEGVFTRMILDDPSLEGVAAVLFDEFHERSLEADMGLALARDAQQVLRDDLRLLVMSATLDGARVSALLGDAPVVESQGRAYPVETRYLGRDPTERIDEAAAKAVLRALAEETGSLLVFLPGQGEIRRTEERLLERLRDPAVVVAPLYGAMDPRAQDVAIAPAAAGVRKVVLATSIAETSLTIEGVRVVIDCGQSRVPRYDPASGLTRLETVRVSRAAADQRRGRAGRTGPGVCYRLWDEPETRALAPFSRPEILEADLSGFALDLASWGVRDPAGLALLDAPPQGAYAEARSLLRGLQALDEGGELTAHGRSLAALPLPPRLAHMLLVGARAGQGALAARIAAVLTERGLGGSDADLSIRLERFERDGSPRARDAQQLAQRWAREAERRAGEVRAQEIDFALLLAEAYPERVARARGKPGEFLLASGRGVFVDPTDALARHRWLAVGELGGGGARDRILLAAPLEEAALLSAFADRFGSEDRVEADARGKVRAHRVVRLGRIVVEEREIERPPAEVVEAALLDEVRRRGLEALTMGERVESLRARVRFLREMDPAWPDLSDAALMNSLADWLGPQLGGKTGLGQLSEGDILSGLEGLIPWELQRRLGTEAPERFQAPTGSNLRIDYGAEGGPLVEVRVQELFGLTRHPTVAGQPLTLALLSPARRPVQLTRDLPAFWKGSWADVRKDMRGRYPKHPWPEDPTQAPPTTRAKPRGT